MEGPWEQSVHKLAELLRVPGDALQYDRDTLLKDRIFEDAKG